MLSKAGKEVLLKAVAQAIPNYAIQVFLLPLDFCRELETMMNSFWWGSGGNGKAGIRWMKWEMLCKPKTYGGIGFKNLYNFNVAMLGKQFWKILTDTESLVGRIFKARYFPRTSVIEAGLGHNSSFVWRSLMAAKQVIVRGSRIQVGNSHNILIGSDP